MTDQQQGIHQSPQLEPTANIPACLPQPQQPAGGITAAPENAEATTSEPPSAKRPRKTLESSEPITEVILRRLTKIKEGDTVLLRLPSDLVKSVVVQGDSLIQLGKYGAFPASQLIGLHYDITYEIVSSSGSGASTPQPGSLDLSTDETQNKKGNKKSGNKGKEIAAISKNNPGWNNILKPLKRQPVVDAVIDDIVETNEFIEDLSETEKTTLSHDEIAELRAQGCTPEEIIQAQIARHEKFGLKTDFSKEKWRRRKEKKFYQTVQPLAPSIPNVLYHYNLRSPQSILHLRDDTLSQLLTMANVRPGGRYLVVDDTGGLITAAVLERMGSEGSILLFNESDSPPAWGILQTMNFSDRELEPIKWLNWLEAEEGYQKPAPPVQDEPPTNPIKAAAKQRKYAAQVTELNNTRNTLHLGGWDGLILATTLNPISVVARLTPYLLGSAPIVVYSPYYQVLAELLNWSKKDPNYLNDTLTESWERTYQVLPGRTHPMMTTSATGGYLWSATRVHPSQFQPESHQRFKRRKTGKASGKEQSSSVAKDEETVNQSLEIDPEELANEGE
ncbi:tRNA (adenine(58)-N(1))-methyltransferase non-catalytic subunit TRM6 [Cryptococcus deuterogattii 99/473]|uniref:tRNA (adenine(58)-N(1))-methyltransferase non-catalytic subunit TRM6 n=1 Tax=Cryptococcus deuterogattii Ram5 TaxID=1296110 RepID=A0A0D0U676_9TREE|nr:tRNA (adenine(58)-N(1))-methyltransferase non-catalytic subunit TRM6 [Cryptococcus deuterogattii Ram5]KIY60480.1 tRNA (adenine(58)-N(1))-methyltransferase non-catalytic subunit TRM6 [Cryptococcus deuterogattii 99/473]